MTSITIVTISVASKQHSGKVYSSNWSQKCDSGASIKGPGWSVLGICAIIHKKCFIVSVLMKKWYDYGCSLLLLHQSITFPNSSTDKKDL